MNVNQEPHENVGLNQFDYSYSKKEIKCMRLIILIEMFK